VLPELLPWLAVLCLLMLKANRTAKAWWIWVPLAGVAVSEVAARALIEFVPSEILNLFCLTFDSLGFGIAGAWLLAPLLNHRLRFLVFLKMLGAVLAMSGLVYLAQDWDEPGLGMGFLVFVGACVLAAVTGLNLAGLVCRRQYRPISVMLWVLVFIAAVWFVISVPFFVFAMVMSGGGRQWMEFGVAILIFCGLTFGMMLPFLVLAFANGWFHERIKQLLHLGVAANPPPIPDAPPVLNEGTQI
jgi:hypothetical protein